MNQPIAYGWSIVGTAETGFDPLSLNLANGQRSQAQNNGLALPLQGANADSGRSGQWDNSQGFIGISNKTYGTLVGGRVNTLGLDGLVAYDPMGSAYAFSPFGYSGSYAGFGDTELTRSNTALKYRLEFMNFHAVGLAQIGSYNQGNGSTSMYQGQVGGEFPNLFGGSYFHGTLSVDAIGAYAQNAVNISTFTGSCATLKSGPFKGETGCTSGIPTFYDQDDVKATLSNNTGIFLLGKYKFAEFPLTISGGWQYIRQANPSDTFPNGFETIGGYNVPGTIVGNKLLPTQWVTYNAYNNNRIANVFFFGGKYAVNPQLDVAAAYYYLEQNNYNSSATPCAVANTTFVEPSGRSLRRFTGEQQLVRRLPGRHFLHGRLSAGQAGRPLRRRDDFERLRRPRERLSGHPEHRSDRRLARQVLTAPEKPPPGACFGRRSDFLRRLLLGDRKRSFPLRALRRIAGRGGWRRGDPSVRRQKR